ncbi:multidrug ABC transporter ATP-binding and permease protein [Ligilactobacillus salitolerans]|uniref:Multidrug ABC transporter ATP-binding and permease protein n=1 Tax=Ligilactobacillus salitolerans TaxID=1808352 RepID=A0A401IS05_9LACO|nr:ABC transporter ATP-binding protein [Ligilactobacillus salitolerans]GBG94285.1 multidrug ABC transporter ATP-binding and permease protein [Ligilactobacillus salitolerans]
MIKVLARSVRKYKTASILSALMVIIESACETIIPFLMARIIDDGITARNLAVIYQTGGILLLIAVISLVCGAGASRLSSIAAVGVAHNIRHDLYAHIQKFSFANIDHFSDASLVTRLTTDITNLQNAYQQLIRGGFRAPAMMIFSIVLAFAVNAQMALIFVVAIPLLAVGLWLIIRAAHPLFRKVFRAYDWLNNILSENIHGIKVVKSYVRQGLEQKKFTHVSQQIYHNYSWAQRLMALNQPLMQLVSNLMLLALFWFGAKLIVSGSMETGELVSLTAYGMQILFSLMMLSMIFNQITIAQTSSERLAETLNEKSTITEKNQPATTVDNGQIDFENVSFSYDTDSQREQLHEINLHIKSGQLVGIIGNTGSGKSTLVELLPRLYDATAGQVLLAGRNVKDYELKVLRDNVSLVLQSSVLFSGTIKENLLWGNENATEQDLRHAASLAQIDDFVQSLPDKYDTLLGQNGTSISGGQRQRLSIARSLLKSPQVLIMDDSTSAVDANTDAKIRQALRDQIPQTTKIIISQRVASIADADLIVVMKDGRISGSGTHEELMKHNEHYRQMALSQKRSERGVET